MSELYVHELYGLRVASTLPLTDTPGVTSGLYDVRIQPGAVVSPDPGAEPEGQGCWAADAEQALYHWSGVGSLLIQRGVSILFDAEKGADETAIRLAILGPAMATILHQRGLLVLHASGVLTERGVVAIAGPSGRGKSTTASALIERGYALFTDDLLALQFPDSGPPLAMPGPGLVKLWPESVEALGRRPADLPRLWGGYDKRVQHIPGMRMPAPLRCVYLLHEGPEPEIKPLAPFEAMMQLMSHSYCSEVLRHYGEKENLHLCGQLFRRAPVKALARGSSLEQLPFLADTLVQDIQASPAAI